MSLRPIKTRLRRRPLTRIPVRGKRTETRPHGDAKTVEETSDGTDSNHDNTGHP
ncbi:hypothetical protein CERZMDRAFT_91282 [Cercospora zeae-maydis SCOH1-5]|uniref:Uncharacterized protein n=1 Tax=Cercospora zeae-maydis SCOH1-5 TaxID=717836 RepID=A0A6A6F9B6_9PEZI|nr:hypothetical protein CERZMDRAFT_91282 [Cercospora zeae-maydis SCOH1-5]